MADLGPIQSESVSQQRSLLNAGVHGELTIQKGINSIKAGTVYQLLRSGCQRHDNIGLINATFNSPCVDASGKSSARVHRSQTSMRRQPALVSNDPVGWRQLQLQSCCPMTTHALWFALRGFWPCRHQGTGPVHPRSDQGRKLGLQPGDPWRSLQRTDRNAPAGTALGHGLQH